MAYVIKMRRKRLVNTDPQRRCYNGCHFSSEWQWSAWEQIDSELTAEEAERRLKFWRDLNAYSVSVGGTLCEFKAEEVPQ